MPWISNVEYTRLLTSLDQAESRAAAAESALAAERAANRESERHWADMFLRKSGSYPQPKKQPELVAAEPAEPTSEVPGMDSGELAAVLAVGAENGHSHADVISTLRRERGL